VKKTDNYVHYYRGYWSDRGKCRIRIYRKDVQSPSGVVMAPSYLPTLQDLHPHYPQMTHLTNN
jgi:hypothetical protein